LKTTPPLPVVQNFFSAGWPFIVYANHKQSYDLIMVKRIMF